MTIDKNVTEKWTAHPFRQFILKVHGRCDLACDYCYVYTMANDRWRTRPPFMSRETMAVAARRIAEHAVAHQLPRVDVVLHGGEPLLVGLSGLDHCLGVLRSVVGSVTELGLQVQTNGIRLDEAILSLFTRYGVRVGVSLDGDRRAHDRHRVRANGTGTYDRVAASLRLLGKPEHRAVFGGVLCTVDTANDPVRTYEELLRFTPPAVDFLLPLGNWSAPPPGRDPLSTGTPYADWLINVFQRWYRAPVPETDVRLFSSVIGMLLGTPTRTETLGGAPMVSIVVETDGMIEMSDTLASTYRGAAATFRSVVDHAFDDVLGLPGVVALQAGAEALCARCRHCRLRRVCGGGLPAHRYRAENGLDNPSVYCPDLMAIIDHIHTAVSSDIAALRSTAS